MKIHEYQAKKLFASFGIPIPHGHATSSAEEAGRITEQLGPPVVIKAQIYAGGRGKAGGVKRAACKEEAEQIATSLLDKPLFTPQTGPAGQIVRTVLVEQATTIQEEIYLGIVVDRSRRSPVVIASPAGGVEIEETAKTNPEMIFKEWGEPVIGLRPFQAYRLACHLGLEAGSTRRIAAVLSSLYRLFCDKDCLLAEINPLVIDAQGEAVAIDAKLTFDDNALYRHPEIEALRDPNEEDPLEIEAKMHNLNYIKLDGNVGCLVNGAGLAMATMDLIKLAGASPANFLDVGGGATVEMIEKGFQILVNDPDVRAVFINIFGGILRCDVLAQGVVTAAKKLKTNVPVIVRLEGTNVEEGRKILKESGLTFQNALTLSEAAELVAAAAKGASS
jgi:succinyl-CoA synthetase beta subunit